MTGDAPADGPDLEVRLDRQLPATVPANSSTAVLCVGSCFGRDLEIRGIRITVDGVRHRPAAQRMPRPDLVAEHGPDAYRSGFWGTIPVEAQDAPGEVWLGVDAQLADGRVARATLGTIAVVERPERIAIAERRRTDGPLIAICMTTFNCEPSLFRAQVDSIRAQTDRDWVCLISDDCSDPESFDAITAAVANDERFVASRNEENLGFYRNFERVLAMAPAEAELIALSDHDDYWYPDKLETLRGALGDATLAFSDARRVDAEGRVRVATLWRGRRENHTNLASLLIANSIPGAACLFRRDVIERALPFPEGPGWDFHDHWLAAVGLALGDIAYVDRPLYDYVQHSRAVVGRVATSPEPRVPSLRSRFAGRLRHPFHSLPRWRSAYFTGYLQADLRARVLLLRCAAELTPQKARALRLFVDAPRSPLAFAWLAGRPARALIGRNETLGTERILLRGLLWRHLVGLHARGRRRPGGSMDELTVPSFEPHRLGTRLRRWIAHADRPDEG